MPYNPIDPASLEGDDLTSWYLRSPQEIEEQRNAAAQEQYNNFFGSGAPSGAGADSDAGPSADGSSATTAADPAIQSSPAASAGFDPAYIDASNAGSDADAYLFLTGNPHNPRLKREWEQREGRPWPTDEKGRSYHVAHKKALADGGTNTLDNIEPMHPDEHIAQHIANGDFSRWAKRPWIARAFGGRVGALGRLGFLSDITGILSGRIRTNSLMNFASDLMGVPSPEDQQRIEQEFQRSINPNWKPGDPEVA